MRRGVYVPNIGDPARIVAMASEIEASGAWDGFFLMDHLQISAEEAVDVVDPWVVLGAVAIRTRSLKLGAMVTPISRRRPWKLAKEIVTLDHLSLGRVIVGIGVGGFDEVEFHAFGDEASVRERAARTDEALAVLDRLLRGDEVRHVGDHYRVDARLRPSSYQRPRPPIWIAATPPYQKPLKRARRWDGAFCNLKVPLDEDGRTKHAQGLEPQTPHELMEYVGGLAGDPTFDIVAMRHPDHEAEVYEGTAVTWLLDVQRP